MIPDEQRQMILEAIIKAAMEAEDVESFKKRMTQSSADDWMAIYKFAS